MTAIVTTDDALLGQTVALLNPTSETRARIQDSSVITTTPTGLIFETVVPTSTVMTELPAGNWNELEFTLDGPAGGGASGMVQQGGNSVGGSAGGAGARDVRRIARGDLAAALPLTITLPLGGAGGAAVTSLANAPGLTGANGGAVVPNPGVGASIIGTGFSMFAGCGAGAQGTTAIATPRAGGAGGGRHGNGLAAASGSDSVGGEPRPIDQADTLKDAFNGYGGAAQDFAVLQGAGGNSVWGGAAGAVSAQQTATTPGGSGGSSSRANAGGGGGGSLSGAGVRSDGGPGGRSGPTATGLAPGGGGTAGVGAGAAGGNGAPSTAVQGAQGGGGGAAGVLDGPGGNGGNGGNGGGGGGGGGSTRHTGGGATSGAGGNGGNAKLILRGFL